MQDYSQMNMFAGDAYGAAMDQMNYAPNYAIQPGVGLNLNDFTGIISAPQVQPFIAPEDNDLEAQSSGEFQPEQSGVISLRDIVGNIASKGVAGFKDAGGRLIASQALSGAGAMINPYLALAGGITGLLRGGDLFDQPYIGAGAATVDEFGRMYSAEELDRMNALGGYYSEPARSSRRRDARISNMLQRREAGLKIGLDNLARLQEQQRREESARQAAASAMQQSNMESGTGGYQSDFAQDSDFMGGSGTAAEMGSF